MNTDAVPDSHHDQITSLSQNGDDVAALRLAQHDVNTYVAIFGLSGLHTANAINLLGCIQHHHGDLADAAASYEQACTIFEQAEESQAQQHYLLMTLCNLGEVWCQMGDSTGATAVLQRAQRLSAVPGTDPRLVGAVLGHLGWAAELQGNLEEAERLLRAGLAIVRSVASTSQAKEMMDRLSVVVERRGDLAQQLN